MTEEPEPEPQAQRVPPRRRPPVTTATDVLDPPDEPARPNPAAGTRLRQWLRRAFGRLRPRA